MSLLQSTWGSSGSALPLVEFGLHLFLVCGVELPRLRFRCATTMIVVGCWRNFSVSRFDDDAWCLGSGFAWTVTIDWWFDGLCGFELCCDREWILGLNSFWACCDLNYCAAGVWFLCIGSCVCETVKFVCRLCCWWFCDLQVLSVMIEGLIRWCGFWCWKIGLLCRVLWWIGPPMCVLQLWFYSLRFGT